MRKKRKVPVVRAYEHDTQGTVILPESGGHWWMPRSSTEWLDYTHGDVHSMRRSWPQVGANSHAPRPAA